MVEGIGLENRQELIARGDSNSPSPAIDARLIPEGFGSYNTNGAIPDKSYQRFKLRASLTI